MKRSDPRHRLPEVRKLAERRARRPRTGPRARVEKVTDIDAIMGYGVMLTPALVVDGEVKCVGKVPSLDEIKKLIV